MSTVTEMIILVKDENGNKFKLEFNGLVTEETLTEVISLVTENEI